MSNNLERVFDLIKSYLEGNDNQPLIVDVQTIDDLKKIQTEYGSIGSINVFDLCNNSDALPKISTIYQKLEDYNETGCCFVYGYGTLLKLYGKEELKEKLHTMLSKAYRTKFVFVTHLCEHFFKEENVKYRHKSVVIESEKPTKISSLVIIPEKYKNSVSNIVIGISKALIQIEKTESLKIYVSTNLHVDDFPNSIIEIKECANPFGILCLKDEIAKQLDESYGDDEMWNKLLKKVENSTIEKELSSTFSSNDIVGEFSKWKKEYNNYRKWLLFIRLKLNNIKTQNWAVDEAVVKSKNNSDFIKNIYELLLKIDYYSQDFREKYEDRKKVVREIADDSKLITYCEIASELKKENAIYYLTDNTDVEKKKIITTIDKFWKDYPKSKLLNALEYVYPDLYYYLSKYNFENDFYTKYFDEYKYLKVTNQLTQEFKNMVDAEAKERSFRKYLKYRTQEIEDIDCEDSDVYFVDALGVEFLSYIEQKCKNVGFSCKIHVCQANLPSITVYNTEFKEYFKNKGVRVKDEKELDTLKHDGKNDYDFEKNECPIHIVEELKIIDKCLENIQRDINSQKIKKGIIVSDHGATRLAFLNKKDMIHENLDSSGEFGGRACKCTEETPNISNAIKENGYLILADYNTIKGGRTGKVEMHGGATLEEVMVPIIEISQKDTSVTITVLGNVEFAINKPCILRFVSSKKLNDVRIKINGKSYPAQIENNLTFAVALDIKKPGIYNFEVWDKNGLRSEGNQFKLESKAAQQNELF